MYVGLHTVCALRFFSLSCPIDISEKSNLALTTSPFSRMPAKLVLRRMVFRLGGVLYPLSGNQSQSRRLPGELALLSDSTFPLLTK
jgi:hypothetical protein